MDDSLQKLEREYRAERRRIIRDQLERAFAEYDTVVEVARALGITRNAVYLRMKEVGFKR